MKLSENLGLMMGPYEIKEKKYYVHEMCALWTANIYFEENKKNSITKTFTEYIEAGRDNHCRICEKSKAGLPCSKKGCNNVYHFRCIFDKEEILFHKKKFKITCPLHRPKRKKK